MCFVGVLQLHSNLLGNGSFVIFGEFSIEYQIDVKVPYVDLVENGQLSVMYPASVINKDTTNDNVSNNKDLKPINFAGGHCAFVCNV